MSYSVLNLKQDLTGVLHQTELNQITNLDGVIDRAARQLLLDVDPQETKRVLEFVTPIYNGVFDYAIADDVKGNKIVDIRPQVRRLPVDIWSQAYNQAFDVTKQNILSSVNMFTMNFNTGLKTLRVNAPYLNEPIIINQIEAISTNGTWATGGTASNLSVNNSNFVQGAGSLQFDVTVGAAYLENYDMTAVNLEDYENQSPFFTWVYIPTGSTLTSVNLRIGSSSTDYYTRTVTVNQQGLAFVDGWNLCQFDWAGITSVGSPDSSELDYARITLNVTGSMSGCKVNGLNSILGTVLEYEYYSKYLFRNASTGAFQETVLDDSDLINLDTESYNLLFNLTALYAVQQQQGMDALSYDGTFFQNQYNSNLARYKAMYKSEVQKPQTTYYAQPTPNRRYGRPRING
jgi:hypothetical protein